MTKREYIAQLKRDPSLRRSLSRKHYKAKNHLDIVQHFQTRCIQRLGKVLRQKDLKECMKNQALIYVGKQSCSKTHWEIPHQLLEAWGIKTNQNKEVVVVYDKLRHGFVTVLIYIHDVEFKQKIKNLRAWADSIDAS